MEPRVKRRTLVALVTGVVVFALLFPWAGGVDTLPPICYGMFGLWNVPCGGWPALIAGAVTAGVVWLALWLWDRKVGR